MKLLLQIFLFVRVQFPRASIVFDKDVFKPGLARPAPAGLKREPCEERHNDGEDEANDECESFQVVHVFNSTRRRTAASGSALTVLVTIW